MIVNKLIKKLVQKFKRNYKNKDPMRESNNEIYFDTYQDCCKNVDKIYLDLDEYLRIGLTRCLTYNIPHEVTIVVPRAEIRKEIISPDGEREVSEIILNSITVVHSPQRPSNKSTKNNIKNMS
jgi:hypothetical protein